MCRNIRTLFNFEPPATDEEIRAASLQFVRKVSGSTRPSQANQAAFDRAVSEVEGIVQALLSELVTSAPPKNREVEAEKAETQHKWPIRGSADAELDRPAPPSTPDPPSTGQVEARRIVLAGSTAHEGVLKGQRGPGTKKDPAGCYPAGSTSVGNDLLSR